MAKKISIFCGFHLFSSEVICISLFVCSQQASLFGNPRSLLKKSMPIREQKSSPC